MIVQLQSIDASTALRLVQATFADAERNGWRIASAVVDPQGVPLASARMDHVMPPILDFALDKAFTAATMRRTTEAFFSRMEESPALRLGLSNRARLIVWGGRESGSSAALTDTGGAYGDPASPQSPTDYFTVTPCRMADTRSADGPTGGPILGGKPTRTFPVTGGACGVPSTAIAVSVNLTAVGAAAAGYFTLFPGNALGPPLASTINFTAGATRANNAIVPLATDGAGTIQVKNGSAGAAHVVLDVNGYFQ
jgi:uncharacterized protein GlcG (DUF336 family)